MPKMKDSGIKWIGKIPEEWKIVRISNYKDTKSNYPIGDGDHGTVTPDDYQEEGVPYIRVQNLSWGSDINLDGIVYISEQINRKNRKSILKPKDIVIAKTGATIGKICIIPEDMLQANTTSSVGKVSVDKKYSYKYVFYSLLCDSSYQQMWDKANMKSAQPGFNIEDLVKFKVCFPSVEEQLLIVEFLDKKIKIIEQIIVNLNNQVKILYEYKKSFITEIVTKGMKSNVKTKNSGIDWIDEISSESSLIKLKYFSYMKGRIGWQGLNSEDFIEEGPFCVTGTDFINGKINWDTCYHVSEERYNMDKNIQLQVGDLLVTKDGTIGKLAKVTDLPDKACLNSHLLIIRPLNNMFTNEFLYYVMSSHIFSRYYTLVSNGSTMESLSQEKTGNFVFPIFSIEVQKEITNYLDKKCDEIDALILNKQVQIEKMKKYKKSLIYEYVTGKKRVKGAEELYG